LITRGAAISTATADQDSFAINYSHADLFIKQFRYLLSCMSTTATCKGEVNAPGGGGKKNFHAILIFYCHGIPPACNRHTRATRVVMTVEIFKLLEMVNFARSGTPGNSDLAKESPFTETG